MGIIAVYRLFALHLVIRSILHLAHNIVALAKEGKPFFQHGLLLVIQIVPVGSAVFGLEGGAGQRARGVFSCED